MGHRPAAAAWMALWWFTEAVPMEWTALLPVVLFPALGVFGTDIIMRAIGTEPRRHAVRHAGGHRRRVALDFQHRHLGDDGAHWHGAADPARGCRGQAQVLHNRSHPSLNAGQGQSANTLMELVDDQGRVVQTTLTIEQGNYRFKNVDKGNYRVRAKKEGFRDLEQPVTAQPAAAPSKAVMTW